MDNLFANQNIRKTTQWVALRGGELYDEKCKELLQWFIDNGKAQDPYVGHKHKCNSI